ncbi:MAG: small multidrug resistance family (SMR) protein [uncultured Paraburkholderia sp.]|nr:MAG: small multidrug resistance family (SMR) protein [uncultured Paraburkholderia sp.]CAH2931276.1 MAG: small multidrug resistance family (SMR) protein [uncultured Paraburkholderia sp.]
MPWILLLIAGLLEVAWAAGLKTSEGFTRLWPSVFTIVTALGSFALLAMAMRQLPLGTAYAAYAVWTGIGAVGAFIFGIVVMGEAVSVARVASATLIDRADWPEAVVRSLNALPHGVTREAAQGRHFCCTSSASARELYQRRVSPGPELSATLRPAN